MNQNKYAKAYKEVLEIIKFFPNDDYIKIPYEKIKFYRNNMDKNYKFNIIPEQPLNEQNISIEANSILVNLYKDYLANDEQKEKIDKILEFNQKKKEKEKRQKYNPDNLFKSKPKLMEKKIEETAIVEYKETSLFTKIKKFILNIFTKE